MTAQTREKKKTLEVIENWWDENREYKATMAELRRCHNPLDVLFIPAGINFVRLAGRLGGKFELYAAALAAVLAHVKENIQSEDGKPARAIGYKNLPGNERESERPLWPEPRFRRLMQIDRPEELMTYMVRLVRHLGGQVNITNLSDSMLWWDDETKRKWAHSYYIPKSTAKSSTQESVEG